MPKIVTLTVNPALDLTTGTDVIKAGDKLRCGPGTLDPGGGGVNVARALDRLGTPATALFAAGGVIGESYRRFLEAEGIDARALSVDGETRLDFTVDERESGEQYRFVLPGPELEEADWSGCLDAFAQALQPGDYAVMSGSLPPGVPDDFYARGAEMAKHAEARPVVDTSGPPLRAALEEGLFLVKPNARELGEILHGEVSSRDHQMAAAEELVSNGSARIVALTLGADGCILASADEVFYLSAPEVDAKSAVGAGDSFLAGLLKGLSEGQEIRHAARLAVAAGAAALLTPATELCRAEDVARLEKQISAEELR